MAYKTGKKFPDPSDSKYKLGGFKPATKDDGSSKGNAKPKHGQTIACYFQAHSVNRPPPANFTIEDIDPKLCTHLIYAYAGIDDKSYTIKSNDPAEDLEDDNGKAGFKRTVELKKKSPGLKVLISIGGPNVNGELFSKISADSTLRKQFIDSVVQFISLYNFDGLDLAWEYPGFEPRGGKAEDKINLTCLIKELKETFVPHKYILTLAISGDKNKIDAGYDLANLNENVDLVFVSSFDYHGAWNSKVVDANAPLSSKDDDNVENTIAHVLSNGISPNKLVLGVSFYGSTYKIQDAEVETVEFGQTIIQGGFRGPIINENNLISYIEIRNEVVQDSSKWTRLWDENSKTPYLRHKDQVISYDSPKSLSMKVKTATKLGLAGIMVWSIDADDFKGLMKGEYPNYHLLRIINLDLGRIIQKDDTSKAAKPNSKPPVIKPFVKHGHTKPPQEKKDSSFLKPRLESAGPAGNNVTDSKTKWKSNVMTAKLDATKKPTMSQEQRLKMSSLKSNPGGLGMSGKFTGYRN